jgi:hypothetical protein
MYLDWSLTVLAVRWPNEQVKVLGVLYSVVHLLRGQIMVVVYKSLAEQLGGFIIYQVPSQADQLSLVAAMTSP